MLFAIKPKPSTALLVLIGFDLLQKTYGVLDRVLVENCRQENLVRDGNPFRLFFTHELDMDVRLNNDTLILNCNYRDD